MKNDKMLAMKRKIEIGEVTAQIRQGGITAYDFAALNPWRFSSEYADDASATVYYNYRHYEPIMGRWMSRDPIPIDAQGISCYDFCHQNATFMFDFLGSLSIKEALFKELKDRGINPPYKAYLLSNYIMESIFIYYLGEWGEQKVFDIWIAQEKKDIGWLKNLPKCHLCIDIHALSAPGDGWDNPHTRDDMYNPEKYHPDAKYELRTNRANSYGAGNQCIYDECGCLIKEGFSAGTADRKQASGAIGAILQFCTNTGHLAEDVEPFDWAYRLDGDKHGDNVLKYISVRPSIW